jgi:Tol biopolymer transport system component
MIYLMKADGTDLRALTNGIDPALSPDGETLAFARWSPDPGLYLFDLSTGNERKLATANQVRSPAWSIDGAHIAFSRATRDYVCRETPFGCLSDDALRAVLGGRECAQTPLGRMCVDDFAQRTETATGLSQVSVDTGDWLDLPSASPVQSVSWRPGSEEISYRSATGLMSTTTNGSPWQISNNTDIRSASWSPNGRQIAVQLALHDHTDIFVLDAASGALTRLTAPEVGTARAPNNVAPAWSPDGDQIIFLSDRDGAWRIYLMRADGSGQRPLAPEALTSLEIRYDFAAERVVSWSK